MEEVRPAGRARTGELSATYRRRRGSVPWMPVGGSAAARSMGGDTTMDVTRCPCRRQVVGKEASLPHAA